MLGEYMEMVRYAGRLHLVKKEAARIFAFSMNGA